MCGRGSSRIVLSLRNEDTGIINLLKIIPKHLLGNVLPNKKQSFGMRIKYVERVGYPLKVIMFNLVSTLCVETYNTDALRL